MWPVLDNRVVFQAAVVFSSPRLALHEANEARKPSSSSSSVLVCHVPSLSLFCIHHGEVVQNLLATWARLFHVT